MGPIFVHLHYGQQIMDKIAVVIRGHLRTWNYLKSAAFDFYKQVAKEIDFFFVTWRVSNLNEYLILEDFSNHNLIKLLILTPPNGPENFYSSWGGPAYLSFHIAPYVREAQKKTTYDAIIETRPDIAYCLNEQYPLIKPEHNSLYTPGLTSMYSDNKVYIGTTDYFFVMGPNVFQTLSDRISLTTSSLGSHYDYIRMCQNNNINICSLRWVNCAISRPNGIDYVSDPRLYAISNPSTFFHEWGQMSEEIKMSYITKYNLNEFDYMNSDNPYARIR